MFTFTVSQFKKIPRSIWALGFVSMFMDISSELIHSLLPIFMVSTLGISMIAVGFVEGIAEATALIVKIFSGTLSDYIRKRKLIILIGYGLAAFTKPLFPLAHSIGFVITARFLDRVGKGIRGAPRDAMIGDIAPKDIRGACFGLRQSMDTIGAFIGPLLAIVGMLYFTDNIRAVLWIAVIPAFISVFILAYGVSEPETHQEHTSKPRLHIRDIHALKSGYWPLIVITAILTLARFSDAFLILKAMELGLPLAWVPLIMVLMNIVYAFAAYPAGILSDHVARKHVLLVGVLFLLIADLILGFTGNIAMLVLGIVFWGMHLAFTQGLLATLVTDTTPSELRGTAYGVFNAVSGIAMLLSSVIAGILWEKWGSSYTFFAGAFFTALAIMGMLIYEGYHTSKRTPYSIT